MGTSFEQGTCVLCGRSAPYQETDRRNCKYYNCTQEDCGDYEISNRAATEMGRDQEFKRRALEMVRASKKTPDLVKFTYEIGKGLCASHIPR